MNRWILIALSSLLSLGTLSTSQAQDKYPSKPVTLIVPQAAGGANDAIARVIAQKPSKPANRSSSTTARALAAMWARRRPQRPRPMAIP